MHHNAVGSLILAAYDDTGALKYIGNAGTGFTSAARGQLRDQLSELERSTSPLTDPAPKPIAASHTGSNPSLSATFSTANTQATTRLLTR
ncbi:hypothetical protein [Rhodococcus sp. (in: high G+C Gram-positive bacteria)]|uniref:ATP dependent DNA ligase n=1 Tax=Rhodococcus sp. TaxID=1831 RepID=UPI003BB16698